jgi:hypothetical protein
MGKFPAPWGVSIDQKRFEFDNRPLAAELFILSKITL